MTHATDERLALVCAHCGSRLVRIAGKWGRDRHLGTRAFRCPRLTACGFGGLREDAVAVAAWRSGADAEPLVRAP